MTSAHWAFRGVPSLLRDHAFPVQTVLSPLARRGHCVVRKLSRGSLCSTLQLHGEEPGRRSSQTNIKDIFLQYMLLCHLALLGGLILCLKCLLRNWEKLAPGGEHVLVASFPGRICIVSGGEDCSHARSSLTVKFDRPRRNCSEIKSDFYLTELQHYLQHQGL